jgi:hypothetical protein
LSRIVLNVSLSLDFGTTGCEKGARDRDMALKKYNLGLLKDIKNGLLNLN